MIPESIHKAMDTQIGQVQRESSKADEVAKSLEILGASDHEQLREFFMAYKLSGVLSKRPTELLDLCSPTNQILEATEFGRDAFEIKDDYICLTSGEGDGFVLYSKVDRKIYDVGVDELDALEAGEKDATWDSFYNLMEWYLS